MTDELRIWALDGAGEVTLVDPTNRAESELALEETLVRNPDMLMPRLVLVGRQTPTAGGPLDLLGVDGYGQLAVFELKRGTLTREAVTQVVDYGSFLESMSDAELAEHIAVRSGNLGIEAIEDFEDWHRQRFPDQQLASLRPVRMALVGLGADERATRMVDFLAKQGVYISLLTFYGYNYEGKTLLVRQVQVEPDVTEENEIGQPTRRERHDARRQAAAQRIAGLGMQDFWDEVVAAVRATGRYTAEHPRKDGITFYRRFIRLPNHDSGFNAPLSVRFTENGEMRITFFPASVHLRKSEFQEAEQVIPFRREPPSNAPTTNEVEEQWFCVLSRDGWATHKEQLIALVSDVYEAWSNAERSMGEE